MRRKNVMGNDEVSPAPDGVRTCTLTTPYGETFAVRQIDGRPVYQHGIAMSVAGIHDRETRARCEAELAQVRAFGMDRPDRLNAWHLTIQRILERHGGVRPPTVRLPNLDFKVHQYGESRFNEIMVLLAGLDGEPGSRYASLMDAYHGLTSNPAFNKGDLLATVLTGKLNTWRDEAIFQLPQAVTYALTVVPAWREAALRWLAPHRRTWVPDYLERNPHVMPLARLAATEVPGIPTWLQHA